MKQYIGSIIGLLALLTSSPAFALAGYPDGYLPASECGTDPHHGFYITTSESHVLQSCITDEAWNAAQTREAAYRNQTISLIHLVPGQTYTLAWGIKTSCPAWFPPAGCVIEPKLLLGGHL